MEKMGFEKNRRFDSEYGKKITETIGGKTCHFRSTFERDWALYCEFRKRTGLIKDWAYEQTTFKFTGRDYDFGPMRYLVDFDILNNDGTFFYEECKGVLTGRDNTKFRRLAEIRPEVAIDLVMMRIPKKGKSVNRFRIAAKYVRRIINSKEIFKQIKGMV